MSLTSSSVKVGATVSAALLVGCATQGGRGYVPPEAVTPPVAELTEGLLKFGTDVKKENVVGYKRKVREDKLRIGTLLFLGGASFDEAAFKRVMPGAEDLLCEPLYSHTRVVVPIENTTAKATAVKELLKPPEGEWKALIKSLGKSYSVDATGSEVSATYQVWLTTAEGKACADAVKEADPHATRNYIGNEFALATGIAAVKTLWDSIWGVVKPAVEGTLKNVDTERRAAAIRAYFVDADNVAALKRDLESTEGFVDKEFRLAHKRTAGTAVVAQKALLDFKSPHWKQVVDDATKCKDALTARKADRTNVAGVQCVDKVFAALASPLDKALDAGDIFDESMAKQLPAAEKRLSAQVGTIAAIAQGNIPADDQARAFWAALVRYAALYNTIKDTGSEDNRKKIDDAIKAFREALK